MPLRTGIPPGLLPWGEFFLVSELRVRTLAMLKKKPAFPIGFPPMPSPCDTPNTPSLDTATQGTEGRRERVEVEEAN